MILKINFGLILLVIFGLVYHVQPVSSEPSFLDTTKSGSSEVEKTETIEVVYMSSKIFSRLLDPVTHLKLRKKLITVVTISANAIAHLSSWYSKFEWAEDKTVQARTKKLSST